MEFMTIYALWSIMINYDQLWSLKDEEFELGKREFHFKAMTFPVSFTAYGHPCIALARSFRRWISRCTKQFLRRRACHVQEKCLM